MQFIYIRTIIFYDYPSSVSRYDNIYIRTTLRITKKINKPKPIVHYNIISLLSRAVPGNKKKNISPDPADSSYIFIGVI